MANTSSKIRCVLHGSFHRHFTEIQRVHRLFTEAGIQVLAPALSPKRSEKNGFVFLATDQSKNDKVVMTRFLKALDHLGENGFSYFVNPDGRLGSSAAYEFGTVRAKGITHFMMTPPSDPPITVSRSIVRMPELLVAYIRKFGRLPKDNRVHVV